MAETIKTFKKCLVCALNANIFGEQYTNDKLDIFRKILIVSIINSNLRNDLCILSINFNFSPPILHFEVDFDL